MKQIDGAIIQAKQQLYRDEILDALDKAQKLVQVAKARNAWHSTGSHAAWRKMEDADKALADARDLIGKKSRQYVLMASAGRPE